VTDFPKILNTILRGGRGEKWEGGEEVGGGRKQEWKDGDGKEEVKEGRRERRGYYANIRYGMHKVF